jgi:hypothetical protein
MAANLWIIGTSVSIEDGGYATRLSSRVAGHGIATRNLSIGDQTSVMGYMRVLDARQDIAAGDTVVWEYSLLDTLLTESLFDANDVQNARRLAWQCLLECGANAIVLMTAPKKHLHRRSPCEDIIASDAATIGMPCIDTRELFKALGIREAAAHYRDDRHPRLDSPLVDAMVDAVLAHLRTPQSNPHDTAIEWLRANTARNWHWLDAQKLAADSSISVRNFRNSLLAIDAVPLQIDATVALPPLRRVVGIGCVSTHESGGLWCGHPGCPPASLRLPAELPYAFLLRTTSIPYLRGEISRIVCAPDYAYGRGVWCDYGQALSGVPAEIGVFGVLYETGPGAQTPFQPNRTSRLRALLGALYRRLTG